MARHPLDASDVKYTSRLDVSVMSVGSSRMADSSHYPTRIGNKRILLARNKKSLHGMKSFEV